MILGLSIMSLSIILLGGSGFRLLRMVDINLGAAAILAILVMITGIGMGISLPASNNACIELMPDKDRNNYRSSRNVSVSWSKLLESH